MSGFGIDEFGVSFLGSELGEDVLSVSTSSFTSSIGNLGSTPFGLGPFGGGGNTLVTSSLSNADRRGFGTARFGLGYFGTGDISGSFFNLQSAQAISRTEVKLVFDASLTSNLAIVENILNYSINYSINVLSVDKIDAVTVILTLGTQIAYDKLYTVTVSQAIVGFSGQLLNDNTATFKLISSPLRARRVNKHQYFNPAFGIVAETYDDI